MISFGLDEEDAHRFRTNRRWHLVTGFVESAGFYQLPDSDKALHGDTAQWSFLHSELAALGRVGLHEFMPRGGETR